MTRLSLLALTLLILQAACGPAAAPVTAPALTAPPLASSETPTETPLPSATLEALLPPGQTQAPPSTATVEALQLFFPTIVPVEGAEYRPPLYPVPWALSPHDHFYFTRPIAATYPADPVADHRYGATYFGPDKIHTGVDLPAPRGTEVLAAGPGMVVWAGVGLYSGSRYNTSDPYGLAVAIRHDFGFRDQPLFTAYAHMDEVDVVVGQWVDTGEVIGNVGTTGFSTGPHLHFEVRLGENDFWKTRNPELWIAPPQGYGVLVGRVMSTGGFPLYERLVIVKSLETGRHWLVYTYPQLTVNKDPYYDENVVLGGLPAGVYEIHIGYGSLYRKAEVQIIPGQVTFFSFYGWNFYDFSTPQPDFTITP